MVWLRPACRVRPAFPADFETSLALACVGPAGGETIFAGESSHETAVGDGSWPWISGRVSLAHELLQKLSTR